MPMFTFNAAKRVMLPDDIGPLILDLLRDKDALTELQTNAKTYAESRDAVLDYVWKELLPYVPAPRP